MLILNSSKFTARITQQDSEYIVRFREEGKHLINADYHTNDKQDAIDTAHTELKRMKETSL